MFDELALSSGSRLPLLAGIGYTLWLLQGTLLNGWSVGTVFFWMGWELFLSGASTTLLLNRWQRVTTLEDRKGDSPLGIAGATALVLLFAALFTLLALAAEGVSVRAGTMAAWLGAAVVQTVDSRNRTAAAVLH